MRVVVTGGAGFIGTNLTRRLLAGVADHVVVIDDLSTGARQNLDEFGARVDLIEASILDEAALAEACTGADAVVHLAARPSVPKSVADPATSHEVNATGTLRVLEAARAAGNLHTIIASSAAVYGPDPAFPTSENAVPDPRSPYAVQKLAAEGYAATYTTCFDLPTLSFRFFNVFGPGQDVTHDYAAVIPAFIDAALSGRPLPIHGDGKQTRDFVSVGSICEVVADALARRVTAEAPVNLAFGSRRSLLDLIDTLEDALGHALEREHQPTRPGDVRHSQADQTRLRSLFPDLEPEPFEQALAATLTWARRR